MSKVARLPLDWTTLIPSLGAVLLPFVWGRELPVLVVVFLAALLGASVLAAVHHAEVVAHRVGEPFGSLVLAVAVTIIEVGLILTLMSAGGEASQTLARDTIFSAAMITLTGIVGISLLVGAMKHRLVYFNPEGTGAALATVLTLATLGLVLPRFTQEPGPQYSPSQLAFAAFASLLLYLMFVSTQTRGHRDFFLPVRKDGTPLDERDGDGHAEPPSDKGALKSVLLLLVPLVAVVGLAKAESPAIEAGVAAAGLPASFVGVVIALLVLAPETLAAVRASARNRAQTSLNLAVGSAMASIGLTIPAIAVASIWLDGPLMLGLDSVQITLLLITGVVSMLTVMPGRATRLQGGVHLVLLLAFVFLAANP
jgi:Ca2+:H+ antiporter